MIEGIHRVRAKAVGFEGEALFQASADYAEGTVIGVIAGNNQRGAIRQPLPSPFVVAVTDTGANLIPNATIEFEVTQGSGQLQNGETTYTTTTDSDGRASAHFTLGPEEGFDVQRVVARLVGTEAVAGFTASGLMPDEAGQTSISGVVLDNQDTPLPGVTVRVDGASRQAVTDDQGQFIITESPVGPVHLIAEGSTTTVEGEWPSLSYNIVTVAGADNPLPAPIYMVKLDTENAVYVGLEDKDVTHPDLPGFNLKVLKDSVTFPDGSKEGYLSITPVNSNKIPMPPPNGMQPQLIVTIQPHNARFDPPAELTLPNVDGHAPGAEVEMYSYDHDLEEFVTIGVGTVSKDGSLITSNEGTGVIKAGWHCGSPPGGSGCCSSDNGGCGHCYDPRGTCAEGCVFQPERRAKEQTEGNCQSELCRGSEEDNSDEPEDLTEDGDCRMSGCRDGQVANDLFDTNDAPDDEFGCYVCDPESKSPRRDPNKSLPESEQIPDDCKDLKCVHWESKDETSELKNNYPCKKCSSGRIVNDTDASCDDELFCTSADGISPGPDNCENGVCKGKKIERQEDVGASQDYDLSNLGSTLSGGGNSRFCNVNGIGFVPGIKMSFGNECCESDRRIVPSTKISGSARVSISELNCSIPAYSILGVGTIGVTGKISLDGILSGSGISSDCEENCSYSVSGSLEAVVSGGVFGQVLHPDVVRLEANVSGSGSISLSDNCGELEARGCVGPPSVSGSAKFGGAIEKSVSHEFSSLVMCWPSS